MIEALDTTALPAQICRYPEPIRAGVDEDAQGLTWRSNIELKEDFHAEITAHCTPSLLCIFAVIRC